jgi:hypothetical protein
MSLRFQGLAEVSLPLLGHVLSEVKSSGEVFFVPKKILDARPVKFVDGDYDATEVPRVAVMHLCNWGTMCREQHGLRSSQMRG